MPQLDFSTYPSQFLWLLVIFSLQYIVMVKIIVPGFTKIYRERRSYIEKEIELAEKLVKQSENLKEQYEKGLASAKENHTKLVNSTIATLQATLDKKIDAIEVTLYQELKNQEQQLRDLEKSAKKELENVIMNSALTIINKVAKNKAKAVNLNKYIN